MTHDGCCNNSDVFGFDLPGNHDRGETITKVSFDDDKIFVLETMIQQQQKIMVNKQETVFLSSIVKTRWRKTVM